MANKKKRTPKTSKGVHGGGGKVRLDAVQKVLLGGGLAQTFKPVGHLRNGPVEDKPTA